MASIPWIPSCFPSIPWWPTLTATPAALRGKRGRKNSNELQINDDWYQCRLAALPAWQTHPHRRTAIYLKRQKSWKKLAFKIRGECFRFTAWNSWAVGNNLPGVRLLFSHKYLPLREKPAWKEIMSQMTKFRNSASWHKFFNRNECQAFLKTSFLSQWCHVTNVLHGYS